MSRILQAGPIQRSEFNVLRYAGIVSTREHIQMITDSTDVDQAVKVCCFYAKKARRHAKTAGSDRERVEYMQMAKEWELFAAEMARSDHPPNQ
jgi:hypothetical protein